MVTLNLDLLAVALHEIRQHNLSGCLTATSSPHIAYVYFTNGNLQHSKLLPEGLEGEEALYTLVNWREGLLRWNTANTTALATIDQQQAIVFYEILAMLEKRDKFFKPLSYQLDPAFFAPEVTNAGFSSAFWQKIIEQQYRPYKELPATKANFDGLLRAFETSKRTGIIKVEYNGLEMYYLIETGKSLGSFNLHSTSSEFKPLRGPLLPLFDLPGSSMDVFLVPPTANLPSKPGETEKPVVDTAAIQVEYDMNNPYDF